MPQMQPKPDAVPPIVRWWNQTATEHDQLCVLAHIGLSGGLSGVPWAFLPADIRAILTRRVRLGPRIEG